GPILAAVGLDDRSILFHRHAIVEVVGAGPLAAIRSPDFAARILTREYGILHSRAFAVAEGGQIVFFGHDDGIYALQGGAVSRIDEPIRRHERYGTVRAMAYADGRLWVSIDDGTYSPATFIFDTTTGSWHWTRRSNDGGGTLTGGGSTQVIAQGLICGVRTGDGDRVYVSRTEVDADTGDTVIVVNELLPDDEPEDR